MAERSSGQRAILPVAEPHEQSRPIAIPLVAAAALIGAVGLGLMYARGVRLESQRASVGRASASTARDSTSLVRDFLGAMVFLPNAATAAEAPGTVGPFKRPAQFDGRKLQPALLEYERHWTPVSGPKKVTAHGSLRVSRVTQDDTWKVERDWTGTEDQAGNGQLRHQVETSFFSGRDLKVLSREIHVTPYLRYARINVNQRFSADSVTGRMTTEGGDSRGIGRPVAQRLSANYAPFSTDAIAPVLMRTVDIRPNWSGSFSIVGWAVRNEDVLFPITLRVVGSERITVPAGTFDCWRMTITVQRHDIAHWVRKSDGVGVLTRDDVRLTRGGIREIVLVADKSRPK